LTIDFRLEEFLLRALPKSPGIPMIGPGISGGFGKQIPNAVIQH
jgi:hypothetical protein